MKRAQGCPGLNSSCLQSPCRRVTSECPENTAKPAEHGQGSSEGLPVHLFGFGTSPGKGEGHSIFGVKGDRVEQRGSIHPRPAAPGAQDQQCPEEWKAPIVGQDLGFDMRFFSQGRRKDYLEVIRPRVTMDFSEINRKILLSDLLLWNVPYSSCSYSLLTQLFSKVCSCN